MLATITKPDSIHYFLAIAQDEIDFARIQSEAHTMTIDLTLPARRGRSRVVRDAA